MANRLEELRGRARYCRSLAEAASDQQTIKTLLLLAAELESEADRMETDNPSNVVEIRPRPEE